MSWDFSTDPDYQEQLDWMAEFVRREIWPLETIWHELGLDGLRAAIAPLQEQVKERGLWATHLPPELGGQGMGQVRLGLMHEILGTSPIAPLAFGNAAPGLGQLGDPRDGRHAGAEGPLAAPAARGRPAQRLQHDRAGHARLGPDAAAHARGARRRRTG